MRTSYPTPSFADIYRYTIVDSTFLHAVHLAKSKGNWTYTVGVSFLNNPEEIVWYVNVKDPEGVYARLADPRKSPGFTFNNTLKGKQYTKQEVVNKPKASGWTSVQPLRPELRAGPDKPVAPKQPEKVEFVSTYGPLLATCQKPSSCIGYLALGYDSKNIGLVIYYALKNKPHDVYALEIENINEYKLWTTAESLGKYYNRYVKNAGAILLKSIVKSSIGANGKLTW